jgi:hypothetical protein
MAKAKTMNQTTTTSKQLLRLAKKDGPGHSCVVFLDKDGNVSLREEDTGHEIVRLLPETLETIYRAVTAEREHAT